MSKRKKEGKHEASVFDKARNELFSQIRHCGVLNATEDQRAAWLKETMAYMAQRYPEVTGDELAELEAIGRRYCEPVIPHGGESTALTEHET